MTWTNLLWRCVVLLLALSLAACDLVGAPPPNATAPAPPQPAGTPSLAATAVPAPSELLRAAMAARAIGDDALAGEQLSALLQQHPQAAEAVPARFYLAESYARRARWSSAAESLRAFLAQAPADDALRPAALFWLARAHEAAGAHEVAIGTYQEYRALKTAIEPYAALRQAAQEQALGRNDAAAASYLYAARASIIRSERAGSFEKAIALLQAASRPGEALDLYGELLSFAQEPGYRARILGDAAVLADSLGSIEQARAWRLELLATAPASPQAAAAVDALRAASDPALTPAQAGQVYVANERWADAVTSLDAAIAVENDLDTGTELRRLRGLALRAQGDFPNALAALADAAARSPNGEAGRQAQLDWVQTVGQSGETQRAIDAYSEFAAAYPDDRRAPVALDRAVQLRERLGDSAGALQARLDLGRRFPSSSEGRAALHAAGLTLFEAGRFDAARDSWQLLADNGSAPWQARGAYWAGRSARALGDEAGARERFAAAFAAAPDSYEGSRAADELNSAAPGTIPLDSAIPAEQWTELEAWVASWAPGAPALPDLLTPTRAALLAEVGLRDELLGEWLDAQRAAAESGPALLAVARGAHEGGVATVALRAAEQLAALAPEGTPPPPVALRRLIFPAPFAELVRREALERDLDPRLLLALFRQESLFDPDATSWVGARGLAQVMPETGQGIAQNLGESDFALDDLYRPSVSVRFGAFYLGRRISDMSGSVQGALAAYNGGLGNAQRWAGGNSVADPDLFTERIDFAETRGYVRAVYGFWGAYKRLYKFTTP